MGDPMQEARRGAPHDALAAMTGGGGPSYSNTGSSFGGGTRSGLPSGPGQAGPATSPPTPLRSTAAAAPVTGPAPPPTRN
jgi:hypothetical protein